MERPSYFMRGNLWRHAGVNRKNILAMKHRLFLCATLLALSFTSYAQQFSFGVLGGYSLTDVIVKEPRTLVVEGFPDYDVDAYYKPLHSWHAGAEARLQHNDRLAFAAGLRYSRKGYRTDADKVSAGGISDLYLYYLNLPVVADYSLWRNFSLQAGLEPGYLLHMRVKLDGVTVKPANKFYNDFDLGAVAGLEFRINDAFYVGLRHTFGIYSVAEIEYTDPNGESAGNTRTRNSATQLSIGYRFKTGASK